MGGGEVKVQKSKLSVVSLALFSEPPRDDCIFN